MIGGVEITIAYGAPTGAVQSISTDELYAKKSTQMWMRMLSQGKWDRRRIKRIMRLVGEGR